MLFVGHSSVSHPSSLSVATFGSLLGKVVSAVVALACRGQMIDEDSSNKENLNGAVDDLSQNKSE